MKRILVTGGTGNLGKEIVNLLSENKLNASVLTSHSDASKDGKINFIKGDLTRKDSLMALKNRFDIIVHSASNPPDSDIVDVIGTQNLLDVIKNSIAHFIYISIVGVDKSTYKYYQNKHRVENIIKDSGIPFTTIRATQFHDFVLERIIKSFDKGSGNKFSIPENFRFQTIDIKDVSKKVLEVIKDGSLNGIVDVGGPEILTLEEMLHSYLELLKRNERIETEPSDLYKIFATGINLCPEQKYGTITWEDYLQNIMTNSNSGDF